MAGGWCVGSIEEGKDPCNEIGDPSVMKPAEGLGRLEEKVTDLLQPEKFRNHQCE